MAFAALSLMYMEPCWCRTPGILETPITELSMLLKHLKRYCSIWEAPCTDEAVGEEAIQLYRETIARHHAEAKEAGNAFPEVLIEEVWKEVGRLWRLRSNQKLPRRSETAGVYVPKDMGEFAFRTLSMAFEFRNNPTFPMPEMKRVLTEIKERGVQLGIVSNAQFFTPMLLRFFLNSDLEDSLQGKPFSDCDPLPPFHSNLCVYSYRETMAKPGVGLYELLKAQLQKMGIEPSQTLYVGNDMLNDIYPAQQLEFKTALFAGDQRSLRKRETEERVQGIQPDMVITHLSELLSPEKIVSGQK